MRQLESADAGELRDIALRIESLRHSRTSFAAAHVNEWLRELAEFAGRLSAFVDAEDFWESQVFRGE